MVFTNLTPFPYQIQPLAQITPFTYRDGRTFLEILEEIRNWLNTVQVPQMNDAIQNAIDEFQAGITNAENTILNAQGGWQASFDAFTTSLNASFNTFKTDVNTALDGYETDIAATKTQWQNDFDAFMVNVEAEIAALSDAAAAGLVNDPASQLGTASRSLIDARAGFATGDRVLHVSLTGDNANSGLLPGRAKRTIQAAIDALAAAGGGIVRVGAGVFEEDIVLKSMVSVVGAGMRATTIKSPAGSTARGVVTMDSGPVTAVLFENFLIESVNTGQDGFYLEARAKAGDPNNNGGLWNSVISSIRFRTVTGNHLWLRGGGTDNLKPHQFLHLRGITAFAVPGKSALRMSGQVGQVQIEGCQFDGTVIDTGDSQPAVRIEREISDLDVVLSDIAPYTVNFLGTTIQTKKLGVRVSRARGINFYGCYMENLLQGFTCEASGRLSIYGHRFANVGLPANGAGGYLVNQSSGDVLIQDCDTLGVPESSFIAGANSAMMDVRNSPLGTTQPSIKGQTQTLAVDATNTLTLGSRRTGNVSSNANALRTIVNSFQVGEQVFLRPTGGPLVIETGGNINLGGFTSPLSVAAGAIVSLVKMDYSGSQVWHVVSKSI